MESNLVLETARLLLRPFRPGDAPALLEILGDREVNRFLPMFPLENLPQAEAYLEELLDAQRAGSLHWAVCRREEGFPVGYIHVDSGESRDLGYGLRRDLWGQGIVTEAGRAVVEAARAAGLPYLTATHDRNNPASGAVMRKLGMTYRYSYVEQWQPKNIPVTFRMYQLTLDGGADRTYRGYWDRWPKHFVEPEGNGKQTPGA